MRLRPGRLGAAALLLPIISLTFITGCAPDSNNEASQPAPLPTSTSSTPAAQQEKPSKSRNDLARSETQKSFKSGDLTVNVTYSTTLPTAQWTPSAAKPITLSLSAINNSKDSQKIYLSRTRVGIVASDANGTIGNPINLVDSSNINPGFLVNFPYTYEQNFTIPALDDGATAVSMTFNYELLPQVDKGDDDYTKQTATSTIKVPLA